MLSSQRTITEITEHLLTLTIDEILNEFSDAGITNMNRSMLKTVIVLSAQPELIEQKIKMSVKAKKTPITPEQYRAASQDIAKAYLEAFKKDDRKALILKCQTLLTNIDKLMAWPKDKNGTYNEDWLKQTRLRIQRSLDSAQLANQKIISLAK